MQIGGAQELSLIHPDDCAFFREAIAELHQGKRIEKTYRVVWPNGEPRYMHEIVEPVFDASGKVVQEFWTIRDIHDQVVAEERLRQSQRIEAIGQLTGVIAHDFNNLLAMVMGNLELVLDDGAGRDPEHTQMLQSALEAAERGAALTRNMLAFARKSTLQPVTLDIQTVVTETRGWVARTIPTNIEIRTEGGPCRPVSLDPVGL